ncbi:MAG: S1 RNA-binding domain-containing protein [Proteobacteria bacterium]|nr:S1 RNA-binding domain-containing protein [Pseudomonadota bacterium]
MRDFRDAKAMARTLRDALAAQDAKVSHSQALELVAKMLGARDWNTLAAAIDATRRREAAWTRLEGLQASREPVMGAIVERVRGGFTVDLGDVSGFLPGSQVDVRPVRDYRPLMADAQPFAILKMDRPTGAIVVSRRAVLEQTA